VPQETTPALPATSSVPPDFAEKQRKLFEQVLTIMNEHQVPYAVSGAFALQQHTGIWRYTKDLDLFLSKPDVPAALELLQQKGYLCEICDPVWLAKAHRDDFFVDLITGMSNGVISVDRSWIQRAQPAIVVGVETRVMAAEELIASKLFVTRRERFDGADIAHVIHGRKGQIDWDRILALVGEQWEILLWALIFFRYAYPAHSDYVPFTLWEDLLTRYMTLVSKNDPKAKFRGSLLDENLFAIDVKEWGLDNVLEEYRAQRTAKPTQVESQQVPFMEQPKTKIA
jgi:hypothetical protein